MNGMVLSVSRGIARVTGAALGPYQTAVVRIGFGATWLLFLLRELPHRGELYGPDGPWGHDLAEQLIAGNGAITNNGHRIAGLHVGNPGSVVAGCHDISQRQQ